MFVWHDVRSKYAAIVWTYGELLGKLRALMKADPQQQGLIAQTDYSGDVVWSGCTVCVLGIQAYHRDADAAANAGQRRWRKVLLPVIFCLNPFEDADHYGLAFSWAKKTIMMLCHQGGIQTPTPIFDVCHIKNKISPEALQRAAWLTCVSRSFFPSPTHDREGAAMEERHAT